MPNFNFAKVQLYDLGADPIWLYLKDSTTCAAPSEALFHFMDQRNAKPVTPTEKSYE